MEEKKDNDDDKKENNKDNINNTVDKKQILQEKLKKIFFEREANKYKYNVIHIPDNLKYSSDDSNNSISSKEKDKNKKKDKKNINENNKNNINNNNNEENKDNNGEKEDIKNNINNKNEAENVNEKNNENKNDNNNGNNQKDNNEEIDNKIINKNKDEDKNDDNKNDIIKENKEMADNNNNINNDIDNKKLIKEDTNKILDNNNINKIENCNNKVITFDNKEDNSKTENNQNDININQKNNNNENSNISKHPSKNYVIKRIPERKKNKLNETELKNKTYALGFINNKFNKENDKKDIKEKEKEEENNKLLYRQLMAKKCQNFIKEAENKNNNNIKIIKDEKDNNKEIELIPEKKEIKEEKKRSKTININKFNNFSTKEGTFQILELIKAKKNEKNIIDEKMKETKNKIKEDIKPDNQSSETPKENKNNIIQIKDDNNEINNNKIENNQKPDEIKENNETNENVIKIKKNENKKEDENIVKIENDIKERNSDNNININKQIYRRFKGKSCLIGNNNYLSDKNNTTNPIFSHNKTNSIEKMSNFNSNSNLKKEEKIIKTKINRHHTSLNVSKKNYVIRPQFPEKNDFKENSNYHQNTFRIQNTSKLNNNIYEPKKSLILYKKHIKDKSLNINMGNKSPKKIINVPEKEKEKITYIKKSLLNNNNTNKSVHKLNNSIGNISPFIDNNNNINKMLNNNNNKMRTELDSMRINYDTKFGNLNSSFKLGNELGKTYYNIGNIFNLDNIEEDNNINLSNNFNINFNLDSLYNINYPSNKQIKNIRPNDAYNTFYTNNIFDIGNNIKNDMNFGKKKIRINNIYNYNKNKDNNERNSGKKNIYENKGYNSLVIKNDEFYHYLKYEDLIILEDKLSNIIFKLDEEKIIHNDCFEFWNYFFNCSLHEHLTKIYSNYDNEYKTLFKKSINYNLMSIMLSYEISLDKKRLDKIRPLLQEMLEFSHKILIIFYELILNIIPYNVNNIWIDKINLVINKSKLNDESDSFFADSEKISDKEKLNSNINYLSRKIYYILSNYPSKNTQKYLINLFKNIHDKSLSEINSFYLEYIFQDKDIKYSILANSFIKSGEKIPKMAPPFLKFRKSKKYFLVCDIDETLFHFKISDDDEEQGILKIRPGVFQLIKEIKNFYEIILFSEADKEYIDLLIDAIGNKKHLCDYILCRDYISIEKNDFIKDLNKIGTPLDKTIIIDNMPQNFRKNKENAIYIKSFFGDENDDKALIDLIPILVNIAKSGKDVRLELPKYKEKIVTKISSNFYLHKQ